MSYEREYLLGLDELGHMRKIFQNLDSMRKQRRNCDLIIIVEENKIHANKDILCAGSDYFNAMFSHNTLENESGVVEMHGVSYVALMKCIDFIYTGKMSTCEQECEDLLYTASLLQLDDICDKVQLFLVSRLDCESFFDMREICENFSLEVLTAHCDNFATSNLLSLADQEQFLHIDYEYLSHLLLSCTAAADSKLLIGIKWLNHNSKERDVYLMKIVGLIDMERVSRDFCRQLAESEPVCKRSAEFMTQIVLALTSPEKPVAVESKKRSADDSSTSGDTSTANSLILFHDDAIRTYILNDSQLKRLQFSLPFESDKFSTCIFEKYLYAIVWYSTESYALNTESWEWRRLCDSYHCNEGCLQCVAHDGNIYAGGHHHLRRFVIALDRWETIDLDSTICNLSSMVVHNNRLYIIGGRQTFFEAIKSVSSCSLDTLLWENEQQLRIARHSSSATTWNGKIYVAGGMDACDFLSSFEMYDIRSKIWIELPQMLSPGWDFRLLVVSRKLYAVGTGTRKSSIDVFDPVADKWSEHPIQLYRHKMHIVATATVSFQQQPVDAS